MTLGVGVALALAPLELPYYAVLMALSLVLGVLLVIPIGGADMPGVVSLLNPYSGLAPCAGSSVTAKKSAGFSSKSIFSSGLPPSTMRCTACAGS